jgi:predicted SAM-dependent methyltransferase
MATMTDVVRTVFGSGRPITSYARIQVLVSWMIRDRKFFFAKPPEHPFYLDIGCGSNISERYYNIDYEWKPGVHRCLDLTKRKLYLAPSSVSGVFTEHCIEHLEFDVLIEILRQINASMVNHAWLRIIVPDGELYCRSYVASIESGTNMTPFGETIDRYKNSDGRIFRTSIMSLNSVMRDHGHLFVYDFETIETVLRHVGFRNVQKLSFMIGNDPVLLKDTESRKLESLYIECQK